MMAQPWRTWFCLRAVELWRAEGFLARAELEPAAPGALIFDARPNYQFEKS
jgi:hypothetical protein